MTGFDEIDFFRGDDLVDDPYPYVDHLRKRCPVQREPHHDVVMVTGHAEALAVLRADRNRIPNFVEETLRYESPVKGDFPLARVAATVGGVDVSAGTTLMVVNGAANRDPRQFECPAEFRVDRDNAREHLAFGHGAHFCPGAPLARTEGRVSVERLLDRLPDITISEREHGPAGARRYEYAPTYILRGLKRLHLEFRVG